VGASMDKNMSGNGSSEYTVAWIEHNLYE